MAIQGNTFPKLGQAQPEQSERRDKKQSAAAADFFLARLGRNGLQEAGLATLPASRHRKNQGRHHALSLGRVSDRRETPQAADFRATWRG